MSEYQKVKRRIAKLFEAINDTTEYYAVLDHTCCNTCGHAEIDDQMKLDLGEDDAWSKKGYIFYHTQETDSIKSLCASKEPVIVHLAFSTNANSDAEQLESCKLMWQVIRDLAAAEDMDLQWEGTLTRKMILHLTRQDEGGRVDDSDESV